MYQVCTKNGHPLFILSQRLTYECTDLYLNIICRNFLISQNIIFNPIHVVPLHDFSILSYITCRFEKPLRAFSIWSYTNYAFEKSLRGFYTYKFDKSLRGCSILFYTTYTFEELLRGFTIWFYTNYTFEKPLRSFSKTMHFKI